MHHMHATDRAGDMPRTVKQESNESATRGRMRFFANDLRSRLCRAMLAAAGSVLAAAALSVPASAEASHHHHHHQRNPVTYKFTTLDDQADPTFNQLLGINDQGKIAGYFGSGTPANVHPNKGYTLNPPYGQGNYANENFPGSQQTQVTGLNNRGLTVGFSADANGDNFGFFEKNGAFVNVVEPNAPTPAPGTPAVTQLLGVNDRDSAVGFYTDAKGDNHGFTYDIATGTFTEISIPGFTSITASGINNDGAVVGFVTAANGSDGSWIRSPGGQVSLLEVPNATSTQALGISSENEVVGVYTDAAGKIHGFTWTAEHGFTTGIDDPNGIGTTTINGVNDRGQLVGFYVDAAGNTDGMLANPVH